MLVSFTEILNMAEKGGYAIPAFNVYNMETVMGVIAAAEAERAPVILQCYSRLFTNEEGYYLAPVILAAAKKASVPVCFHLDHGAGEREVERALRAGATGIMIDASTLPLEENIAATKAICDRCGYVGVSVEGELGHIGSTKDEKVSDYTDPAEAARYAKETGIAAMAIMVGTAHGRYKQAPKLDIDRIRTIKQLTGLPLVLHGGSGVPDEEITAAIAAGIRKINFGTDLCYSFLDAVFATSREKVGIDLFMKEAVASVSAFATSKIRLLGAAGRA
ncbi:MAG: class II fructose-bisphosphate aldolase [Clostridia bacterium]|nr:class II fructose-bisphosphate aldolase [Clostridia bacterium]